MGWTTERRRAGAEGALPSYGDGGPGPRYKWIALSNTTLGVLIATINISIMLIALPDIFRGIGVDPLRPGNTSLLLWLIMSYMVVTAVLVVSFGRLGDMYGRVRMYNLVLGPQVLDHLPAHHAAYLTGRGFFPALISPPFSQGLSAAFDFAIAACLVAAVASLLRGGRYVHKSGPKPAVPVGVAAARVGTAGVKGTADPAGGENVEDTSRQPVTASRQAPPPKPGPSPSPPPPSPPPSSFGGGPGPPPEEPR